MYEPTDWWWHHVDEHQSKHCQGCCGQGVCNEYKHLDVAYKWAGEPAGQKVAEIIFGIGIWNAIWENKLA